MKSLSLFGITRGLPCWPDLGVGGRHHVEPHFALADLENRRLQQSAGGPCHVWAVLRWRQLHHPVQLPSRRPSGTDHLQLVRVWGPVLRGSALPGKALILRATPLVLVLKKPLKLFLQSITWHCRRQVSRDGAGRNQPAENLSHESILSAVLTGIYSPAF